MGKRKRDYTVNVSMDTDVDLNEFSTGDIVDYLCDILLDPKEAQQEKDCIGDYFSSRGVDISYAGQINGETIRDKQYDEVLEQLREKYTVAELEKLL